MSTQTIAVRIQKSIYISFEVTVDKYSISVIDPETRVVVLSGYRYDQDDFYYIDGSTKEIYYFQDIIKAKIARAFKIKWY